MLKNNVLLVLVVVVMTITAYQSIASDFSPLSEKDVEAIKSLGPSMDQTALACDWDALLALMTDDVLWIGPNIPEIQGQASCKSWLESVGMTITEHKVEFLDIDGCGDLAYARGPFTESVTVEGVEGPIEDAGNVLAIVRKQSDGSWLIAIWMWNSKLPLPE